MKTKNLIVLVGILFSITVVARESDHNIILSSTHQSKVAKVNETITYSFEINNVTDTEHVYHVQIRNPRTLACQVTLKDTLVTVKGNQVYHGAFLVQVSDRIPVGGQESSFLDIKNEGNTRIETLEFITVRYKPHPFIFVTDAVLAEAKDKVKHVDWAKQNLDALIDFANQYEVPERKIVDLARNTRRWKSLSYHASDSEKAFQVLLAYKFTGHQEYLNKVLRLVKEVTDPEHGYLSIGAATTGVQVHEGNFFMYLAAICDVLYGEDVLTKQERENIENTMRLYLEQDREHMSPIGIMNHQASANVGAVITALFLQDMTAVNHFVESDGGLIDQMTKGIMADGWWFEGTPGYCYLVTERFSLTAQAFENYGWNLYDRRFPMRFKSKDFENVKAGYTGMKFDIWGPTGSSTRGLKEMVNAYIPMMDEDANLIPNNDGTVSKPHEFYELAYRHFGQENLAWVISKSERDSWESLLYGVAELPKVEDPRSESEYVSNVGLVALRSQPKNKTPEDQIQAYFKFGTHGGWHGHLDRTGMIALNRYGHKYFGTEMVWFGYGDPGYKESVQASATHNMVVVDGLQQEAVPSEQLLFYKGDIMQATVVQTKARWRRIPIFNKDLFPPWNDFDFEPDFEPVLQRRLSIVTDDYVVIADYMQAPQKHTYDWMLHPVGFQSIDGTKAKGGIKPTLSDDSNSQYKYFTNAQWYQSKDGTEVQFQEHDMKLDVHTLWPKKADVVVASYPNGGKQRDIRNNPDRATYGVRVSGKEAQFLTVLEPYKNASAISKITSKNENELTVYLKDGKKQVIRIAHIKDANIKVTIKAYVNEVLVATNQALATDN
ncbi:heparinase II/III family protein [uncultured Formosa sp.]|uniref:heparinase II/III family protein n=1 Tax=uncultured Formosa sp. TaxID=255435 RepID=UPI00262EB9B2|nr:heparinase II/III family protein [uncultured Formosa sp.]